MQKYLRVLRRPLASRGRAAAVGLAGLAAVMLAASACSSTNSGSSGTSTTSITIGDGIANVELLPIWVAQAKGYFAGHHLKVKMANLTDTTVVSGLMSGSAQYAQVNVSLFVAAVSQNLPVLALQNAVEGVPVALIVTNKFAAAHSLTAATPIATVIHDLRGSTGGFSSPVTKGQANVLLNSYGVSPSDVKEASFSAVSGVEAAFKKDQIDWFVTGQPTPDLLQYQKTGIVVADRSNARAWGDPTLINQVMVAQSSYAAGHKAVTQELLAALQQGSDYINKDPAGAAEVLMQNQPGLPVTVAREAVAANVWPTSGAFTAQQWAGSLKFAINAGEVPSDSKVPSSAYSNAYLGG